MTNLFMHGQGEEMIGYRTAQRGSTSFHGSGQQIYERRLISQASVRVLTSTTASVLHFVVVFWLCDKRSRTLFRGFSFFQIESG